MQLLFSPFIYFGIRSAELGTVALGLFPSLVMLLGYLALRSGLWTHPWSEADLLSALDTVLGDVRM
jgi:hypothetical protein